MKVTYKKKTHEAIKQKDGRLTSKDGKLFFGFGIGNLIKGVNEVVEPVAVPEVAPIKATEGDA